MNVPSAPLLFPINHRRAPTAARMPMFVNASPIAVSNKIRAIQSRKARITQANYYDYTDIRPLNIATGVTSSSGNFSFLTAEKLFDRSKNLRLERMPPRQQQQNQPRSSVLSTSTVNQQSSIWPNLNTLTPSNKHPRTYSNSTLTPPGAAPTPRKSPGDGITPEIQPQQQQQQNRSRPQTTTRAPLTEQQQPVMPPVEPRSKSQLKKPIPLPRNSRRTAPESKSPNPSKRFQAQQIPHIIDRLELDSMNDENNENDNNEEDENVLVIDDEFEEYLEKAMVKCADWLIKHVFDDMNNSKR